MLRAIGLVKHFSLYPTALIVLGGASYLFLEREEFKRANQNLKDDIVVLQREHETQIRTLQMRLDAQQHCVNSVDFDRIVGQIQEQRGMIVALTGILTKSR